MDPNVLARKQLPELKNLAAELQMRGYQRLRKADLIEAIVKEANRQADPNQRGDAANGARSQQDPPVAAGPVEANEPASRNGAPAVESAEQLRLEGDDHGPVRTLTVTDDDGATDDASASVTVTEPPPGAFEDPSSVPDLALWLQADAIQGLADGDPVATSATRTVRAAMSPISARRPGRS